MRPSCLIPAVPAIGLVYVLACGSAPPARADVYGDAAVTLDENGTNDTLTVYAWKAGDNSAPQSLEIHANVPYTKLVGRAVTHVLRDLNLHFRLSDLYDALAVGYVYRTELIQQKPSSGNALEISLNGTRLHDVPASTNNTDVSVWLPRTLLRAGDNTLTVHKVETGELPGGSSWTQFDYHRLEVSPLRGGTVFLVR